MARFVHVSIVRSAFRNVNKFSGFYNNMETVLQMILEVGEARLLVVILAAEVAMRQGKYSGR